MIETDIDRIPDEEFIVEIMKAKLWEKNGLRRYYLSLNQLDMLVCPNAVDNLPMSAWDAKNYYDLDTKCFHTNHPKIARMLRLNNTSNVVEDF